MKTTRDINDGQEHNRCFFQHYLLGEGVSLVALSESFGKDEFALVHDGDAHSFDTALDPGLFENFREVGEKILGRLAVVSGEFGGGHC